jgi:S-adenosylmethionine:tRNA ribosyltransferase-isomerase
LYRAAGVEEVRFCLPPASRTDCPGAAAGAFGQPPAAGAAGTGALEDRQVRDLDQLLQPGDLLVFNDTRVIPARLFGAKATGGRVEILIERLLGAQDVRAQLGVSKSPKAGSVIDLDAGGQAEVLGRDGEFYLLRLHVPGALEDWLEQAGRLPLPPYITRDVDNADKQRYQTVFAREAGAVAAPTAGLHFDQTLLDRLSARGVQFGHVTLHVGAGTFQPVRVEDLSEHRMHSERVRVSAELVEKVRATRAAGGRVIGVGTTVVRALESATSDGVLAAYEGETRIFITPGYTITSVDALLTNFHLPESTLLMMISAFAGRRRVFAAYAHAIAQRYRFFSYGDAMLLFPGPQDEQDT